MGSKKKFSVWKSFAALIRKIRLPLALLVAAFLLNLGKAVIELVIPDKMAALSEIDLGVSGVAKAAILVCLTIFVLALVSFIIGLVSAYITYIAKAKINKEFQIVTSQKVFSLNVLLKL